MDVTILEVHLPEAEFNAPFARREAESGTDAGTSSDGGSGGLPIAALLVIAGLAVLSWFLRRTAEGREAETETETEGRQTVFR